MYVTLTLLCGATFLLKEGSVGIVDFNGKDGDGTQDAAAPSEEQRAGHTTEMKSEDTGRTQEGPLRKKRRKNKSDQGTSTNSMRKRTVVI